MLGFLFGMAIGLTDEELVKRIKRGDQEAFSDLVLRYQDRVYTYCLRWLGNPQAAEQIAQETLLKVYRGLPRFRGESKLTTWIHRIAQNSCINERKRLARRKQQLHDSIDAPSKDGKDIPQKEIPFLGKGTDSTTYRSEAERIVNFGLSQLDDDQRTIIIMADIEGLSYEEISRTLDLPKGTVRSRLHRARKALADTLRDQGLERDDIFD